MGDSKQDFVQQRRTALLWVMAGGLVTIIVVGGGGYLAVRNGWLTISQGKGSLGVQGNDNNTQQGSGHIASEGSTVSNSTTTASGDGSTISSPTATASGDGSTASSDAVQGDKTDASVNNGNIGNIASQGTINIYYATDKLPGFFPNSGFKAPPSDLSKYRTANLLSEDMIGLGTNYASFAKGDVFILGQPHQVVFGLRGDGQERRVGFKLPGIQKAVLLQFGLQDLSSGTTNLTYRVKISANGELLWGGECRYGQKQQLLSVPLDIPGANSLVIEYSVLEQGGFASYEIPPLYFTKAELLSE
jgi:hypothetical protein